MVYGFDLIYGLPGDTFEGFCASLDFAMGLIPNHVDIFPLAVLPGTRLQETAPLFQLEHQSHAPYQVLASPEFSAGDMARAAELAHAFELFYNQGQAVPWFASVVQAVALTPSAFMRAFASWLKTRPVDEIVPLQIAFIGDLFEQHGQGMLTDMAVDIMTYFGRFEALSDDETPVAFTHNPSDLLEQLEQGVTALEDLCQLLPPAPCSASLVSTDEGPVIRIHA